MRLQYVVVVSSCVGLQSLLVSADPDAKQGDDSFHVVGYFSEWSVYQRHYHVSDIPASNLTHVNYAFAKIANGECALADAYAAIEKAYPGDSTEPGALRGSFNQLQLLKKKHPHLKTLISIGGWSGSGPFSDVALTQASREKFAKSCVASITQYGFDGVDIDWEYPVNGGVAGNKKRPEDKVNFTFLLAELRKQLDERGGIDKLHYLLTIAAPASPRNSANIDLAKVAPLLDWFNLMTYDFSGGWSERTGHHAGLFASKNDQPTNEVLQTRTNADTVVKGYLAAGVPAEKIVLGVPFFGRGWGGVKDVNHGLHQPFNKNLPKGNREAGNWEYKDIAAKYKGGNGERHWDDTAKAPWFYDAKSGQVISYDDPESLKVKAEYVRANKLGGVMAWELNGDDSDASLLTAIQAVLMRNSRSVK